MRDSYDTFIQIALAKDKLRKILTTKCDAGGNVPFDNDEIQWAYRVVREQPEWAHDTLKSVGIKIDGS